MSAEWQFLITLNEHLGPVRDPVTAQDVALRLLGEHLGDCNVHYTLIEGDEFIIARAYSTDVPPFVTRGPISMFGTTIPEAARRGDTVVVNDVATDTRLPDGDRDLLRAGNLSAMVGVPLIKDGRWVAVLGIQSARPRQWTADQIHVIQITADRMWNAGERARAEEALGRSEGRQAFLQRLNDAIRPLADPARVLQETCRLLALHMGVNRVAYGEIEGSDCVIVGEYADGVPNRPARFRWEPLGGSRTPDILKGETLIVNDTSVWPHTPAESALLQASGVGAYLCPLIVKHGRFIGTLGIHSRTPRVWTRDDVALAEEVADRLWTTLEHRRAEAGLRANEERLAFLLRLNDALRPLIDPAAVRHTASRLLGEHLRVARVAYADYEGGGTYVIRDEHARGVAPLGGSSRTPAGGAIGEALLRADPVVVTDVEEDARLTAADREKYRGLQTASFVTVTLFKDGQRTAGFGAAHDRPRVWTQAEIDLVRDVAERTWEAAERARAESALREQDMRLRLALEASAGGLWSWDTASNQVYWDERFRALYGFTADEPARSDAWLSRVHEEDRPRLLAARLEELSSPTKSSWEYVFRIVKPDGTVRWVQSRGRADIDGDGRVQRLTGLDLDFDRHRRLEEAERAQRDEEHDRALRTLLETATQGIVSVDADGVIVSANQAFEAMFGWPPGELIGQQAGRMMPEAFLAGLAAPGSHEVIGVRRDGSSFPIELTVNRVPAPAGGRAFAFVTDITERQRAAAALRARTIELEHRTTQLSQMASDVTLAEQHAREQIAKTLHDGLQQLLVIASTNLDRQARRDAERGAAPSELLSAASGHVSEAIAAARSLSIELYPPVLQRSGLPAALQWLASWVHEKHGLEVHAAVDPRADSARKDVRTLLFESVRELLFNAVKHAQADRVSVELVLDARDQLCITVSDRGVGFDAKQLDRRTKAGHAGWGLFSIRERLTLLGGHFDIVSTPGRGTQVRLIAPRGAAPTAAASDAYRGSTIARGPSELRDAAADALRILVVDDHKTMRAALRELLHERPQLSVVGEATDGLEAITSARVLEPEVILMDASMPRMDGFEATARIHAELPQIEILGLSMQGRAEAGPFFERAGAAAFFVKSTDMQRLVEHLLHVHRVRRGPPHPATRHAPADAGPASTARRPGRATRRRSS
jgi:PAS domain S-box-containing protein